MLKLLIAFIAILSPLSSVAHWNGWKDAKTVMRLLQKAQNSGKSYFSQFQEYDVRGKDIHSSIYREKTGETPYIYALDFYYASGTYFPEEYQRKLRNNIIEVVRKQWRENKAIPSFSWHLENPYVPSDFGEYMGCRFRYGHKDTPYPEKHRYVVKEILTGKGGEECGFGIFKSKKNKNNPYQNPKEWFDDRCREVAEIINDFVDDNSAPIPMIFRLWHECEDSWMWWGTLSVSIEDYKNFFIYTEKQIKKYAPDAQILWSYSTDRNWKTEGEFMLRYPGDKYVDIIGYDDYQIGNLQKADETLEKARIVVTAAKKHAKVAALFETANLNKQTSGRFFKDCLQPLLQAKEINFGIIQLWNVGEFNSELHYNDRKSFLKNSNILVMNGYE